MGEPYRTSVAIDASPADVFPYLVDADLIVRWMGEWAETDPQPGGRLHLDIIGVPVRGSFVEVDPPRLLTGAI